MAEEMILENVPWESDEAEGGWESDDAIGEADDSAEDFGERARRRRSRGSHYRPGRGVRGLVVRGEDGRTRNLPFPAKLATTEETNRGLAIQEAGRRALVEWLERLGTRVRTHRKSDSSVTGVVTLLIGGGLTAWSLMKASQQAAGGSLLANWVSQDTAKMATLASVSQVATTGAKLLIHGRYHGSGVGLAADAFSTAQVAAFAIASFYKPAPPQAFRFAKDGNDVQTILKSGTIAEGNLVYQDDIATMLVVRRDIAQNLVAISAHS